MDLTFKETVIALLLAILPSRLKVAVYRLAGAHIGRHVSLSFGTVIMAEKFSKIRIGDFSTIRQFTFIICKEVNIGKYVHIPQHVWVWGSGRFIVKNKCTFGAYNRIDLRRASLYCGEYAGITGGCILYTHTHFLPYTEGWLHTHRDIRLEDRAILGMNTIILPGVTIGRNSIIGAGSVVNRSIPPNSFAVGTPAKVISGSERFKDKVDKNELRKRIIRIAEELTDYFDFRVLERKSFKDIHVITFERSTLTSRKIWHVVVAEAMDMDVIQIDGLFKKGNVILFSTSSVPQNVGRRVTLWYDLKNLRCCNLPDRFAEDIWYYLRNTWMVNCDVTPFSWSERN